MLVLVGHQEALVLPLQAHLRGIQFPDDGIPADLRDALVRTSALMVRVDLLEEPLDLPSLDLGLGELGLQRRQAVVGDLLLILRNVQIGLLGELEARALAVFQFLLQRCDLAQERLHRLRGDLHGLVQVAIDIGLGDRVHPRRHFLRVESLHADLDDARVLHRRDLDHLRELPDRVGALLEQGVVVKIQTVENPPGDVAALDDFVLGVEVTLFGVPAVLGHPCFRDLSDRRDLARLGRDLDCRLGPVRRFLREGADGHQREHHHENAQDGPAAAPDGPPVIEEMDFPLFRQWGKAVRHDVILSPKPRFARVL